MCELYAGEPQTSYDSTKRSIRLHGVVTSISLENKMWQILEQICEAENVTVPEFIATLYQEVVERHGSVKNLASMLRVTCLTFALNSN
ncbi:ribbon-helix-helix domain-containing protein [Pseudoalteromonas sp. G4]|uniref:ribbon-helix-helix domain-containing protein n=1 Tax=Pseudoalteromonas sp. G4 TaxID=2992761 RepID=UPI00237D8655|nr:ribbon-helix-helix domain-containing protein [Pseudoalteromonas sp. G4]MDE3272030.1 ribbon-helix-helix domain-containing protein [Pseudoalteromonas sp. G4]